MFWWAKQSSVLIMTDEPIRNSRYAYHRDRENSTPPEKRFNNCQAICNFIFTAMVKCQLDILFLLIQLCQYSSNLAQIHYEAITNIFCYLNATTTVCNILHYQIFHYHRYIRTTMILYINHKVTVNPIYMHLKWVCEEWYCIMCRGTFNIKYIC